MFFGYKDILSVKLDHNLHSSYSVYTLGQQHPLNFIEGKKSQASMLTSWDKVCPATDTLYALKPLYSTIQHWLEIPQMKEEIMKTLWWYCFISQLFHKSIRLSEWLGHAGWYFQLWPLRVIQEICSEIKMKDIKLWGLVPFIAFFPNSESFIFRWIIASFVLRTN